MVQKCILLELNVNFASPQQSDVPRHPLNDSYNFVTEMTRGGNDILKFKPLQFKKKSLVQMCKFPRKLSGTYTERKKKRIFLIS